jgi:NAD(P)-dependent dehydrogenase (short-subunit alcohol dehydrogenase family)
MSNKTRTVLVTGASRGIGRATAIAFAEAGFDVAITARTVVDGDPSSLTDDGKVLPGSLASTAAAIEALGQRAVQVPWIFWIAMHLCPRLSPQSAVLVISMLW